MGMFSDIDYSLIVLQLEKAMANGVATLDSNTKVPKAQISLTASDVGAIASTGNEVLTSLNAASGTISSGLLPSYVDDVLNYTNLAGFPGTGETGKIYVDETTNKVYRWSGSVYVEISSSATAGEALKLTTPRTITTTGDASYSVSFDGSANVTSAITLATVNSNVGSFGSASSIPAITVNAKGQVTAVSTNSIGNELIALQSLSDTPGFLKKTGDGTYSIDINSYLSLAGGTLTGALIATSFSGVGTALTALNASNISTGTINAARLPASYLPLTGGTITGDLISTSATPSTSPTTGASRVAGGQGVQGNQYVGGFSSLGGDANHPGIKIKELRGLTAAVQGGTTYFFNGVHRDKILALSAIVLRDAPHHQIWTPGITIIPGYYFEFYLDEYNYTVVLLHPTNSEFILSKEIVVTILYKE
jgi:hypothetical protein